MESSFPPARRVRAGGVAFAIYERNGDPEGRRPPILLLHGWPEIAYSWRNQIGALAAAGFRAVAIDLKGYGASDAPEDPALYDIARVTDELCALMDALKIRQAIVCGHDWGGAIVWPLAQRRPTRVAGVIAVCTPHRSAPPTAPLTIFRKRFGEDHYIVRFQEDPGPEALFAAEIEKFFRVMFRAPAAPEAMRARGAKAFDLVGRVRNGPTPSADELLFTEADLERFVREYQRSGFRGGLNYYRNIDNNYQLTKDLDPMVSAPSLWIGAAWDHFLPPEGAQGMAAIVDDLESHIIPECGHWVMWERPDALNALMIDWLTRRF